MLISELLWDLDFWPLIRLIHLRILRVEYCMYVGFGSRRFDSDKQACDSLIQWFTYQYSTVLGNVCWWPSTLLHRSSNCSRKGTTFTGSEGGGYFWLFNRLISRILYKNCAANLGCVRPPLSVPSVSSSRLRPAPLPLLSWIRRGGRCFVWSSSSSAICAHLPPLLSCQKTWLPCCVVATVAS